MLSRGFLGRSHLRLAICQPISRNELRCFGRETRAIVLACLASDAVSHNTTPSKFQRLGIHTWSTRAAARRSVLCCPFLRSALLSNGRSTHNPSTRSTSTRVRRTFRASIYDTHDHILASRIPWTALTKVPFILDLKRCPAAPTIKHAQEEACRSRTIPV